MYSYYWIYLESFVFITFKRDVSLLYNSVNGKYLEVEKNNIAFNLIKKLNQDKNLYTVKLQKNELKNSQIINFINQIKELNMGDILEANPESIKPIQFIPILNIQKDRHFLKNIDGLGIGRNIISNLSEITIFVNSYCNLQCSICNNAHKQFNFCASNNVNNELSIDNIETILKDLKGSSLNRINITGGNITEYSKFKELLSLLNKYSSITSYYLNYINIVSLDWINSNSLINVLITPNINNDKLYNVFKIIKLKQIKNMFTFVISNNDDYVEAETIIDKFEIINYTFTPYFNKDNIDFFKTNVYITKDDIFNSVHDSLSIFRRQVINQNYFGKLIIKANGDIFSNINTSKLGNINKMNIYEAIYKEMNNNKSWFRLRKNLYPCRNCVYNILCPSISNYEDFISKNNLCSIDNTNVTN